MNPTSQFSENFLKFKDEKYATISGMSSQIKIHFILKTLLLFPIPTNTINYFPHKFVTHVIFFKWWWQYLRLFFFFLRNWIFYYQLVIRLRVVLLNISDSWDNIPKWTPLSPITITYHPPEINRKLKIRKNSTSV